MTLTLMTYIGYFKILLLLFAFENVVQWVFIKFTLPFHILPRPPTLSFHPTLCLKTKQKNWLFLIMHLFENFKIWVVNFWLLIPWRWCSLFCACYYSTHDVLCLMLAVNLDYEDISQLLEYKVKNKQTKKLSFLW